MVSPIRADPTDLLCSFSGNQLTESQRIAMEEPITNDFIQVTRKNFLSEDSNGKMIEKSLLEIKGMFLLKIRDNAFKGIDGENIEDDLFLFDTPLCIAFEELNYLLKIDPDLFTYDIQWIKTYDKYEQELNNEKTQGLDEQWSKIGVPYQLGDHICEPYCFKNGITKWPTCSSDTDGYCKRGELPGMVRVSCMTYFQDHKWYDNLIDEGLKQETLKYKAQIEESWGDATPSVMKFCAWLKNIFENFHELDYDVLIKLEECWWKVNTNEVCPFTHWDNRLREPYVNAKPKWTFNPCLNINHQPEWNNETNNRGNFQEGQRFMEDLTHEPLDCTIRRFEMAKYTFEADE
ncbi:hypothetical protein Tco_0895579 [Tanacetum coccineum]|uniref:Uncharacterized protein n=1 Tax=Tanacetum coccineum TaxID=301880 RepID=A0ABQ5CGI0_9ASTR